MLTKEINKDAQNKEYALPLERISDGAAFPQRKKVPPLAAFSDLGARLLVLLLLELQPVAAHAARVVVKGYVSGREAVRDEVPPDPALDTAAGGVDGGVLEAAGAVARPVVCRGRRQVRRRRLDSGCGLGELD